MGRINQPFTKFVEVGRVVYIAFGHNAGKICAIVDIIDQNRALVDGPCSNVRRHPISFNRLHLTKFLLSFNHSDKTSIVRKAWTEAKISEKWAETKWAKGLKAKKIRRSLTDFDRFKLKVTKQMRRRLIDQQVEILKRKAKTAERRGRRAAYDIKMGRTPYEVKPRKPKPEKQKVPRKPRPPKAPKTKGGKKGRKATKEPKAAKAPKATEEPKVEAEKQ